MLADLEIAMEEGRVEGKTEAQKEIVNKLFIKGYSAEQIASMIDASVHEIKSYLNL